MAAWMSLAAPSMLLLRSNWIVIAVEPSELVDVICGTPGICASCRSSGCATDDAMVSGLPPSAGTEESFENSPSWGSPAPRVSAANAAMFLARIGPDAASVLRPTIEQLLKDAHPAVRMAIATHLN